MTAHAHLAPDVIKALSLPKTERIEFCRTDRWVGYTRATEVLRQMEALLSHPKSLRMSCLLLVGRSNNGKSSILEHFLRRNPVIPTPEGEVVGEIVYVQMPETPDETEFWSEILWHCGVSHREKDPAALKKRQVKSHLQYSQARLLVIDEFNNLTNAGKAAGYLLAAIKGLSNDLKIPIIAAGTQAAINALNSDPQMKSRFDPAPLPRWELDGEYRRFLASYERLLPLADPSDLSSRELATKLYGMAGDTIGMTVRLLKDAAVRAVEEGEERITPKLLDSLNWTSHRDWDSIASTV